MEIDIEIEVEGFPPYDDTTPFDPYQETASVSEETYSKVLECYRKGILVLREMNIPELEPIIQEWEEEIKDEAYDRYLNSEEEEFIEPSITVKIDEYNFGERINGEGNSE